MMTTTDENANLTGAQRPVSINLMGNTICQPDQNRPNSDFSGEISKLITFFGSHVFMMNNSSEWSEVPINQHQYEILFSL